MIIGQNGNSTPTIVAAGAPTAATGAQVPINTNGNVAQAAVMAAGIQAQSLGGLGGLGGTGDGDAGQAGAGGAAGSAGFINIALNSANITTTGFAAAGVLAQSIGGAGGNGGGAGGMFSRHAGNGAAGGAADTVVVTMGDASNTIWPSDLISTHGDDSMGVVAQSIGGGGGAGGALLGGSVFGGVAIGGDGEAGGASDFVMLNNGALAQGNAAAEAGFVVATQGEHSTGLVAQSIGGGGGTGGSASNTQLGVFNYTVGGNGGSGGAAGIPGTVEVSMLNQGIVSTMGDHAKGMVAQAVGGGGGDGGSAAAFSVSSTLNINTAVGGTGGSAGTAGDVQAINNGEVLTSGADAWGLLAQSVSGGGGNGGSSLADAFLLPTAPGIPTVEIDTSVGGSGGDSAPSGNVTASNGAVIMTAGPAAHGLMAQSIAGGGGNGGDSSTFDGGVYTGQGVNFNLTTTLGGQGGQGGTAGNVTVNNTAGALVWTLGDNADGILAQSISGGGGTAGTAKNTSEFVGSGQKGSASFTVGGAGGSGGNAGTVSVTNAGNIMTIGDGSNGIFAQSIGGGGGISEGGTVKGSAGKQSEQMKVAGGNGVAGNGNTVNVTNNATILTYGGDAAGVVAQSIGGGGGKGGTGTTAGLDTSNISLSAYLSQSSALNTSLMKTAGVEAFGAAGWIPSNLSVMQAWAQDYLTYAAAHPDLTPDALGGSVDMQVFVGGGTYGGEPAGSSAQGDGGQVTGTNNFSIITNGPASPGMLLQSIGAGGGTGGEVVSSQFENKSGYDATTEITVGGKAYNLGDANTVTANNSGSITTGCNATLGCNPANGTNTLSNSGDASFGILAQSIGGGGGESIVTAGNYASITGAPIQINLAGDLGTMGNGGSVVVNNNAGGSISTSGNDSVGIVAQSIGGGGGNVVIMQATKSANGLTAGMTDPTLDSTGSLNSVTVGSNALPETTIAACTDKITRDSCGVGGSVTVTAAAGSSVTTAGRNAHGVLAQSIGGGGGWIAGLAEKAQDPFSKPDMEGNGGNITMNLGGTIATSKDGSYGVLAQSVGGGGVLGGDLASTSSYAAFPGDGENSKDFRVGLGGTVTINNTGTITTTGNNAMALFAQSVGGGGGLYATTAGLWMGTAGGTGAAGAINIYNSGTIQATGNGSSAIYINSQGSSNTSQASINNTGTIEGNSSTPAIMLTGGNGNGDGSITNGGTITNMGGTAVASPKSFAVVTNTSSGNIVGALNLGSQGSLTNYGTWSAGGASTGAVTNLSGATLNISGGNSNPLSVSTLTGNLDNEGIIHTTVDYYNQNAGVLSVAGNMNLGANASMHITPTTLTPNLVVPIFAASTYSGALTMPVVDAGSNYLFNYSLNEDFENEYDLQASGTSHFLTTAQANGASGNALSAAQYLDSNWNGSMSQSMAQTYAGFSNVGNGNQYLSALQALGNEGAAAASVAHVVAGNAFVERMNSCPRFDDGGMFQHEHDCVWVCAIANDTERDSANGSVGYHQNSQVFQAGGQKEVAPNWFIGGSASYDNSNVSTDVVSDSLGGEGWTAGMIAKHQMGDWLVSAAVEGGEMSYTSTRQAQLYGLGGTATAKFGITHFGVHSRVSRQFAFERFYLKPYVDLHATHIDSDGYTEHGAGPLDLNVAAAHTNVFAASPMIEAGSKFDFGKETTLQIYAGVGGAIYGQNSLGMKMQLADSPGPIYFTQTSELPSERFKTTAGLDLKAGDHMDVRLELPANLPVTSLPIPVR